MNKTTNSLNIKIIEDAVMIDTVYLGIAAIGTLDAIQHELADHYIDRLQEISDLLLESCEYLPVEYEEMIHILQTLRSLRSDILTLKWGVDTPGGCADHYTETVQTMELAEANDNPETDADDDDDSGIQSPGQ